NLFYLTILYSFGYLAWYGGWGDYDGFSGWTSVGELQETQARGNERLEAAFPPYVGLPIDEGALNTKALAPGPAIFPSPCATCHGSSAEGALGFPNLRDDIWHWGDRPEDVLASVIDGREGVMPPWGDVLTGMGGENAVRSVVHYTRSLGAPDLAGDYFAARGRKMYEGVCVACHGVDGKGNAALGAPDLTDDYWLYGGSIAQITQSIANGR